MLTSLAPLTSTFVSTFLAFNLLTLTPSFSWFDKGHRIVALIAQANLTAEARKGIEEILPGNMTLADAAVWPDQRGEAFEISIPSITSVFRRMPVVTIKDVTVRRKTAWSKLLNGFQRPSPTRTRRPWCGESRFIMSHTWWGTCTSRSTPVEQPLHAGRAGDQGRVDISVSYGVTTNLHYFWDSDLVEMETGSEEDIAKQLTANLTAEERLKWQAGDPIAVDQ